MESYNPNSCCRCGSREYRVIASGPIVPIVVCAQCQLMRQGPAKQGSGVFSYRSYAGSNERFTKQRLEKEAAQLIDQLEVLPKLEQFTQKKGYLLEIGCSAGILLNEIRKEGWKVAGVDALEWGCNRARKKYGLDVVNAHFQDVGYDDATFDAVLMFHVIEHIPDPPHALRQLNRMIKPSGILVLETPRYDTIWFKVLKGRERSVIPGHLFYFTRRSLTEMASEAGFALLELESVGRTATLDRLCFGMAKVANCQLLTLSLASLSNAFHLNKANVHINLRDMMRLYLRKT